MSVTIVATTAEIQALVPAKRGGQETCHHVLQQPLNHLPAKELTVRNCAARHLAIASRLVARASTYRAAATVCAEAGQN